MADKNEEDDRPEPEKKKPQQAGQDTPEPEKKKPQKAGQDPPEPEKKKPPAADDDDNTSGSEVFMVHGCIATFIF